MKTAPSFAPIAGMSWKPLFRKVMVGVMAQMRHIALTVL